MDDAVLSNDKQVYRPGEWAVTPGVAAGSPGEKSPPLAQLYPEKDKYLIIPQARYTDPAFAELEWKAVWSKVWTCAGLASDIADPGQWFKYDLGRESFVVVRQKDGSIKAFYNVCQHRGRQLVTENFGRNHSFVCQYHSWVFDLDGKNRRVTDREYFEQDALSGDLSLKAVRCETWAGFVFISMDENAKPLREYLDGIPGIFAGYHFENMHVVKDVVVEVPCNWKIGYENFLEPYHAHITHPEIQPAVDEVLNQYDFYRNGHGNAITRVGLPSERYADKNNINPALAFLLQEAGINPEQFQGRATDVRQALIAAKRKEDNPWGIDYSGYVDSQLMDDWNPSFFPNMTFNAHPEGTMVLRFLPHPSDPSKYLLHQWVLIPKTKPGVPVPYYMGVEPDVDISGTVRPARRYTTLADPQMGLVVGQDIANQVGMQRGVSSKGLSSGVRLSEQEQRLQQIHAEIDRLIAAI
ncbi:aromatic ring-hydroxylating oxygenase subunit alpha [Noviherbaspirillum sedimenti]|uniref:Aromatic ring-hydroxylating dioxygenase subunit alpha n=1 Tax=Noviherbaspirillum sedimenti TaxID=2320865 RepID=A0A3A3G3W9_9BURK|nr:aromatic ring-hydroxylating dioxygenase subunit alpha [Noviherbaspirillum sedimenti]RJG03177.1 aromatic ring-hydroxylating dioxygenase subunit alpha [Noviherbaspirillum sedimenti]